MLKLAGLALMATTLLVSCRSEATPDPQPATENGRSEIAPAAPNSRDYIFCVLESGRTDFSKEKVQELGRAHAEGRGAMARAGKLLIAGPFAMENPAPHMRGIYILDAESIEEGREIVLEDRSIKEGLFKAPLFVLRTHNDLAQLTALETETQRLIKEGQYQGPMRGMQSFAMAFASADDLSALDEALDRLSQEGQVLLHGSLSGDRKGQRLVIAKQEMLAGFQAAVEMTLGEGKLNAQILPLFASENIEVLAKKRVNNEG